MATSSSRFRKVNENTPFTKAVLKMIKKIPRGKVATYGQIAKISGNAGGSRGVAWILHACSKKHKLPWQRVINSQGKISFHKFTKEYKTQKRLLEKEGVQFSDSGTVNFKKFQWSKKSAPAKKISASVSGVSKVKPKMFG